jgi:4-hydroxyproline epimerase
MQIQVIDSHTGGEPTRLVVGGLELPTHDVVELRKWLDETQLDLCHGLLSEPRGSSAWVGAILVPPLDSKNLCGVVFFNTHSSLGMCGHGTIGLVESLKHLARYQGGKATIETPVGEVEIEGFADGSVVIQNVISFLDKKDLILEIPGFGSVVGDVAWGGNWFFLVHEGGPEVKLENLDALMTYSRAVKNALWFQGIRGGRNGEIDHVELFGPSTLVNGDSKNFVLCPSLDYDRSPCGTGTSAKLACLYTKGQLREGEKWVQESITGSAFVGWVEIEDQKIRPHIRGAASIMGEGVLHFKDDDIFRWGIR